MKKKFFLNKTVDALSEKQIEDLNAIFGGAEDIPVDDHIPTGGGGPRCPDGYYWNVNLGRCLRAYEPVDHKPVR
ncbi:MAG: hypothetical protein AB8B65_12005 [Kordia sp.]|uniref:hypothetical protein n=1 Tax=Kordia sp. TaxID=1965332 RepID=UPI0038581F61